MLNVSASTDSCFSLIKHDLLLGCSPACSAYNLGLAASLRNFKRFSFDFAAAIDEAEEELVWLDELLKLQ